MTFRGITDYSGFSISVDRRTLKSSARTRLAMAGSVATLLCSATRFADREAFSHRVRNRTQLFHTARDRYGARIMTHFMKQPDADLVRVPDPMVTGVTGRRIDQKGAR